MKEQSPVSVTLTMSEISLLPLSQVSEASEVDGSADELTFFRTNLSFLPLDKVADVALNVLDCYPISPKGKEMILFFEHQMS
ncbi:hypothetical protein NPIL_78201 [Nephila pilipes]|uniref:Uncharacterized protein n=1 Tax=Nephila pilipes TaxID=299642 RepID=A0A8X6TB99_NEPPI|nr:hypothetical protein NPIL_78201 [Nephila pilipes]